WRSSYMSNVIALRASGRLNVTHATRSCRSNTRSPPSTAFIGVLPPESRRTALRGYEKAARIGSASRVRVVAVTDPPERGPKGARSARPPLERLIFRRQFYLQLVRILVTRRWRGRRDIVVVMMGGVGDLVN